MTHCALNRGAQMGRGRRTTGRRDAVGYVSAKTPQEARGDNQGWATSEIGGGWRC